MDDDILNLIEQRQFSRASQAVSQRIKKFPNRPYYPALQNVISYRQGHEKEAVEKMIKLRDTHPNCKKTIGVLYDFFIAAGRATDANVCYENALRRYPSAEGLGADWLEKTLVSHQYCPRVWNKIFMGLHRNHKLSRHYTYAAAFTYLLMIKQGDVSEKEAPLFALLGLRLIEDLGYENSQELFVLIQLWALNGDVEKMVPAVKALPIDFDVMVVYRQLLREKGEYQHLYDYCVVILGQMEDFELTKMAISAGKEIGKSEKELADIVLKETRNGWLAKVELAKAFDGDVAGAAQEYYKKMGSKLCCVGDLHAYEVIPKVEEGADAITKVNNLKFRYLLGEDVKQEALALSLSPTKQVEYDLDPVSDAGLISVILDVADDPSSANIIKNISVLEKLAVSDKYNHKVLLWLMKLYNQLNCGLQQVYWYRRLSIKMVQHETLGHLLMWALALKDAFVAFNEMFRFYLTADHEVTDCITTGFNNDNWTKLELFTRFGNRLDKSISRVYSVAMNVRQALLTNDWGYANYFVDRLREMKLDQLEDNRDFMAEWKLGVFDKPLSQLAGMSNQVSADELKAWVHMYLAAFSLNQALYKAYNKAILAVKPATAFDKLMVQFYTHVFKLSLAPKPAEKELLMNYLNKNLNAEKVAAVLPEDVLHGDLNKNLMRFSEFTKLATMIFKKKPNPEVKKLIDLTLAGLKKTKWTQLQQQKLREIKANLDEQYHPTIDAIAATVEKLLVSLN